VPLVHVKKQHAQFFIIILNNYIFSAANNVKSKEMLLSLRLFLKNVMINLKQIKQ